MLSNYKLDSEDEKILNELDNLCGVIQNKEVLRDIILYIKLKQNNELDFGNYNIIIRNNFQAITFNNSNGEIEPTLNTNTVLNSYRKPDIGLKSSYINPNITGPYSKPKGLNKDKKYIGISAKKLFSNSDLYLSPIKDKKNI